VHVIVWLSPSNTLRTVGEISTVRKAVSKMYAVRSTLNGKKPQRATVPQLGGNILQLVY
jgi:hypothetical protein